MNDKQVLGIETAVSGGSIYLSASKRGLTLAGQRSRAELILPAIDRLLGEAGCDIKALDEIAVSAGPGSFTGIRIGIATAMGLSSALEIPLRTVSLLKAIGTASEFNMLEDKVVAIAMGRGAICVQGFNGAAAGAPVVTSADRLERCSNSTLILTQGIDLSDVDRTRTVRAEGNLAAYIASYALTSPKDDDPIFLSKSF